MLSPGRTASAQFVDLDLGGALAGRSPGPWRRHYGRRAKLDLTCLNLARAVIQAGQPERMETLLLTTGVQCRVGR